MNKFTLQLVGWGLAIGLGTSLVGGVVGMRTGSVIAALVAIFAMLGVSAAIGLPRLLRRMRELGFPSEQPTPRALRAAGFAALYCVVLTGGVYKSFYLTGSRLVEFGVALLGIPCAVFLLRNVSSARRMTKPQEASLWRTSALLQIALVPVFTINLFLQLFPRNPGNLDAATVLLQNILIAGYSVLIPLLPISAYFIWRRSLDRGSSSETTLA